LQSKAVRDVSQLGWQPDILLLRVCVRLDDSEHITGGISRVSKPADLGNRHFRHANFSATLFDLLDRFIER